MSSQSYLFNPTERTLAAAGDGFSCPRLTTAGRTALTLTAGDKGMMVYDTTLTTLCIWTGTAWEFISDNSNGIVSVKDFGAKGDGVTDDRVAIQNALNTGKAIYFPTPDVSYYISDSVSPLNNQLVYGDGASSKIQVPDGSVNAFYVNAVTNVTIRDLNISTVAQINATAYKAAVLCFNSTKITVQGIFGSNLGYWGVGLYNSSYCKVIGCRFENWFGTASDSTNIAIFNNSSYNLIENNYCYGASNHGIFMQDPYSSATPTGNIITGNYISGQTWDGISIYVTTAYDTKTLVTNNNIKDITGTGLAGNSGHGIYIQSAGGTIVSDNNISNCCISTITFETQVVGHIGVATGDTTTYPTGTINEVIVSNNRINAPRGPGIAVQACGVPVMVTDNSIISTGTTAVRGEAIYCANSVGVQITNNTISHLNTNYNAIGINATAATVANAVSVRGNRIRGTTYGIGFNVSTGGTFQNINICDNLVTGLSSLGLFIQSMTGYFITGNYIESTGIVLSVSNCPKGSIVGNRFYSNFGSYSIIFTGAAAGNAGTIVNETNTLDGTVENDPGTGAIISKFGNAAPAGSGLWNVGDRVIQSVPVVGQPKGWRCTVAGNPGTWVSEGNL
jgi:hypothetical protein